MRDEFGVFILIPYRTQHFKKVCLFCSFNAPWGYSPDFQAMKCGQKKFKEMQLPFNSIVGNGLIPAYDYGMDPVTPQFVCL